VRGLLIAAAPGGSPTSAAFPPPAFQPTARYVLDPQVALRPEPFGALAYHYGSRRLTFLRSPLLVEVVRSLPDHPSVKAALDARVPEPRRPGFLRAIASLADSRFIVPAPLPDPENPTLESPTPESPTVEKPMTANRPPRVADDRA
jgi:putative mycofactocin binding protein MftB